MKYIIMCGGFACQDAKPKHFFEIKGKPIVQRTIELLKECGINDIAITTSPNRIDDYKIFGVDVIPYNSNNTPFVWLDAFYPINEPVCYIFGDVVFSPEAIKTIVETETKDIEFFASAPPFADNYPKRWAEPFAFKVQNVSRFGYCVQVAKDLRWQHVWYREPIAWELWQIIKNTPANRIIYDNYVAINDYTCDVDSEGELTQWQNI